MMGKTEANMTQLAVDLLAPADVRINGDRPWDIQVNNKQLFTRIFREGSIALGESYMDGWWDCERLDELIYRILRAQVDKRMPFNWKVFLYRSSGLLLNRQTQRRSWIVGREHYDLGNDIFEATFDSRITGSCGYWDNATNLDAAQDAKLDLICRKISLKPGQTVLDIGCGWGAFMKFAAENYGANCVGVTVSEQQVGLGRKRCAGLPVEFKLMDYRDITGKYDHIVSMGMFEHVGYKNFESYFKVARSALKDDGLFLLHTIGANVSEQVIDPWLDKYIFPNGAIPSIEALGKSLSGKFVVEDWHNFGTDYDKTLVAWMEKFDRHWPKLREKYTETFYRMWRYYLLSCAGGFRSRNIQVWQLVLSKDGQLSRYRSIR